MDVQTVIKFMNQISSVTDDFKYRLENDPNLFELVKEFLMNRMIDCVDKFNELGALVLENENDSEFLTTHKFVVEEIERIEVCLAAIYQYQHGREHN